MSPRNRNYEQIYKDLPWAYSPSPDPELIEAVEGLVPGKALDLGGGQGRHALALSALGFKVRVVDSSRVGLQQLQDSARQMNLAVDVTHADLASYQPEAGLQVAVAALLFHIPPRWQSMQVAERVGKALASGGLFYLSLPGFTAETRQFASDLIAAAECRVEWLVKHLVTKEERPRLPVPRRNETRAAGVKT